MSIESPRPEASGLFSTIDALWRRREVRFVVVGGLNTVAAWLLFAASHAILGDRVPYLALLIPTYGIGIPIAFSSQRILVFDTHGSVWIDFGRYCLVQLTAIGLNAAVLALAVEVLSLPVLIAQAVAIAVVIVLTYFSHSLFSFRRPDLATDIVGSGA